MIVKIRHWSTESRLALLGLRRIHCCWVFVRRLSRQDKIRRVTRLPAVLDSLQTLHFLQSQSTLCPDWPHTANRTERAAHPALLGRRESSVVEVFATLLIGFFGMPQYLLVAGVVRS